MSPIMRVPSAKPLPLARQITNAQRQKDQADRLLLQLSRRQFKPGAVTPLWKKDRFFDVEIVSWSRVEMGEKTRVRIRNVATQREYFTTAGELLTSFVLKECGE